MDGIHLDYDSHRRLGQRMAYLALQYAKSGVAPRTEIRLRSIRISAATGRPALAVLQDLVSLLDLTAGLNLKKVYILPYQEQSK